jgi:hypothetical protein
MKYRAVVVLLVVSFLVFNGCSKKQPEQIKQNPPQELAQAHGTDQAAGTGIRWTVPPRWSTQPPRQMRLATYSVPAAEGDADAGECAVFYFGADQGGSVDANIDRWISQFEPSGAPRRSTKEVNGMIVTLVQVSGTYLAPGGPMMQSQGKKDNYRLLGAIVAGPQGSVFFKYTGPAKTISASEQEFDALINSIARQ